MNEVKSFYHLIGKKKNMYATINVNKEFFVKVGNKIKSYPIEINTKYSFSFSIFLLCF